MTKFIGALLACVFCHSGWAQDKVYRCGNEYTNNVPRERIAQCTLITTGNVTVVPAVKVPPLASVRPTNQRAKDADARFILDGELKRAEARRADLTRNYQKYLDRVAELKANIQRSEADIASIRREISRMPGGTAR